MKMKTVFAAGMAALMAGIAAQAGDFEGRSINLEKTRALAGMIADRHPELVNTECGGEMSDSSGPMSNGWMTEFTNWIWDENQGGLVTLPEAGYFCKEHHRTGGSIHIGDGEFKPELKYVRHEVLLRSEVVYPFKVVQIRIWDILGSPMTVDRVVYIPDLPVNAVEPGEAETDAARVTDFEARSALKLARQLLTGK